MVQRSALISAGWLAISASVFAASPCTIASLDPVPGRFTGITWDWTYANLLLVDVAAGEVRTHSADGALVRRWANPGSGPFEFSKPFLLIRTTTGYVLQDGGFHFIELDRNLTPVASHDFDSKQPRGDGTKGGSMHWVGTGDGILGYGSLKSPDQPWRAGLLRVTWSPAMRFQLLRAFPDDEKSQQPYTLGVATTATCNGRGYQLAFGTDFGVFEVHGSQVRHLRGLPEAFGKLPQLPPAQGMANGVERSLALAATTGAAHLYSDDKSLFVMLRDRRSGTRRWLLARYDPDAERVTGVWLLPSTAIDVHLAPGPRSWALLELSGRSPVGAMIPGKLVLFPTPALTSAGGTVDAPVPVCER